MMKQHTDQAYDHELAAVREQILLMGAHLEEMLRHSVRALVDRDTDLARRTIEADHQVNRIEVETDELCLRILARRQPVASDLRFVTIALKLVTDLERIGDLVVNICERVVELNEDDPFKYYRTVPLMAEAVEGMLREALDSFVHRDPARAENVIRRDDLVDEYYHQMFRELLTYMMDDPRVIYRATRLQSITKYLERIGDHCTNVAELVVFLVKGTDIRHMSKQP